MVEEATKQLPKHQCNTTVAAAATSAQWSETYKNYENR